MLVLLISLVVVLVLSLVSLVLLVLRRAERRRLAEDVAAKAAHKAVAETLRRLDGVR